MTPIIIATVCVAVIGLLVGILLVQVGKKFEVKVDPREAAVRGELPGNNCGACGFAGCDAMAAAIVSGEAPVNGCPVGGTKTADAVAAIMDVEVSADAPKVAFVRCAGDCEHAAKAANYIGIDDCAAAAASGMGSKACDYGCLGMGSCVKACPFHAIHIIDGIARVDRTACRACGKCIIACPKGLIELLPDDSQYAVRCACHEKGPVVRHSCQAGCIGCKLCEKQCEADAIHVVDNIAHIDYEKCKNCGKCAGKCPAKVIEKRFI